MAAGRLSGPRVAAAGLLAILLSSGGARAQVVTNPNQIRGDLAHVTADPAVQAHLDKIQSSSWSIVATSQAGVPELEHLGGASSPTRAGTPYEITVETSPSGIAYRVGVSRTYAGADGYERYNFAPVTSEAVFPEPAADVLLDVRECAALIRVSWRDPLGAPAAITSATLRAWREVVPGDLDYSDLQSTKEVLSGTEGEILVRGDGATYVLHASVLTGTDPFSDAVRFEARAHGPADCNDVIDLVHVVPGDGGGGAFLPAPDDDWDPEIPPGSGGSGTGGTSGGGAPGGGSLPTGPFRFGRIIGRFDVLGESEHRIDDGSYYMRRTMVRALAGPWGNERFDHLLGTPSSGAFELEKLVPTTAVTVHSGYELQAIAQFRIFERLASLTLPRIAVAVPDGQTVDLGDLLVVDPAFMSGDLLLAGPPLAPDRPAPLLTKLWRWTEKAGADDDGNGIPELGGELLSTAVVETSGRLPGGVAADAAACFARTFDVAGESLTGDYELVLSPGAWRPAFLQLAFRDVATPDVPLSYVDHRYTIAPGDLTTVVVPTGDRVVAPMHYCFGELRLTYHATAGTFHGPRVSNASTGAFDGVDFEGRANAYTVAIETMEGTPRSGAPAADGLVVALLPEGKYTLHPRVHATNPSGGSSDTALAPITVTVGCRSLVDIHLDLSVDMDTLGACVQPGLVVVSGRVASAQSVARISVTVNGGAPVDACVSCGVSPAFSVPVAVDVGTSTIVVTVEAADGRIATATQVVTSSREPSAVDLDPAVTPLRVRRQGPSDLVLTWEDIPGAAYHAYQGTIASLFSDRVYDHGSIGACDLDVPSLVHPMPQSNAYFLAGGPCGVAETSLGRDSFGRERPGAVPDCP